MKFDVTQAAKAVGKSRKTLYRHINDGKLSAEKDELDNTVLDVSELQRVYGQVEMADTATETGQPVSAKQTATPHSDAELQLLQARLEFAEKERDIERERRRKAEEREREFREEINRLLNIVETQTRQLVAPEKEMRVTPVTQGGTQEKESQRRSFWAWITGRQ